MTVRRTFHRKDFKWNKIWGYGAIFWKKWKLWMQNSAKKRRQPSVVILQQSIFDIKFYLVPVTKNHWKNRSRCLVHEFLLNVVLILLRQHCTGKNPMQCWPTGFRQHCIKKIVCSFALILLGQNCTGQNSVQCCPKSSRQHCIRKSPVQCCLNTVGTTLYSWKPYAILPKSLQTTLHQKKFCPMLS